MTAELTLRVDGMTCGNCRARVERALNALEGVAGADVNLATERARIVYLPQVLDPPAIAEAIRGAGYVPGEVDASAAPGRDARAAHDDEIASLKRRFVVAAAFTIPLFLIAMGIDAPRLRPRFRRRRRSVALGAVRAGGAGRSVVGARVPSCMAGPSFAMRARG